MGRRIEQCRENCVWYKKDEAERAVHGAWKNTTYRGLASGETCKIYIVAQGGWCIYDYRSHGQHAKVIF